MTPKDPIGAIAIGRNEGDRLKHCLASLQGQVDHIIYVDSGSTDGSVAVAEAAGASVVALDMSRPFTAARARNEGLDRLRAIAPGVTYVQFLDGDCALQPNWVTQAHELLASRPELGVVCGRRRERHPQASLYNRLIDQEWDTPIGEAKSCGGDALMRMDALSDVGGYNPSLIAGEEPEMCVRLRHKGWKIWRLDAEMTLHDAALMHFSQWWRRSVRAGHAYAEGAALHGAPPERHNVRQQRSALIWGLGLPILTVIACLLVGPLGLLLLGVLPLQVLRLSLRNGDVMQALFLTLSKFSETAGIAKYHVARLRGARSELIEYK